MQEKSRLRRRRTHRGTNKWAAIFVIFSVAVPPGFAQIAVPSGRGAAAGLPAAPGTPVFPDSLPRLEAGTMALGTTFGADLPPGLDARQAPLSSPAQAAPFAQSVPLAQPALSAQSPSPAQAAAAEPASANPAAAFPGASFAAASLPERRHEDSPSAAQATSASDPQPWANTFSAAKTLERAPDSVPEFFDGSRKSGVDSGALPPSAAEADLASAADSAHRGIESYIRPLTDMISGRGSKAPALPVEDVGGREAPPAPIREMFDRLHEFSLRDPLAARDFVFPLIYNLGWAFWETPVKAWMLERLFSIVDAAGFQWKEPHWQEKAVAIIRKKMDFIELRERSGPNPMASRGSFLRKGDEKNRLYTLNPAGEFEPVPTELQWRATHPRLIRGRDGSLVSQLPEKGGGYYRIMSYEAYTWLRFSGYLFGFIAGLAQIPFWLAFLTGDAPATLITLSIMGSAALLGLPLILLSERSKYSHYRFRFSQEFEHND